MSATKRGCECKGRPREIISNRSHAVTPFERPASRLCGFLFRWVEIPDDEEAQDGDSYASHDERDAQIDAWLTVQGNSPR
jgi:hypothetical protein